MIRPPWRICGLILSAVAGFCWQSALPAAEPVYYIPPQAGVVDVTKHGVIPDDGQDDTAALQAIISTTLEKQERYSKPTFIYLPKGTYDISDTIAGRVGTTGWSSGWRSGFILCGAGPTHTTLRLKDESAGFGDPAKTKPIVITGSEADKANESGGGNRAFRHSMMNLTIDAGAGNPGAAALDYVCNNRGTVENVVLRAAKDSGAIGLDLRRNWPGPCLFKNVTIEGFDRGVQISHYQYGLTFEHLRLIDQRSVGLLFDNNSVAIRKLTTQGSAAPVRITGGGGTLLLQDSVLRGSAAIGIENKGFLALQNVSFEGFGQAVTGKTGIEKGTTQVDSFVSQQSPLGQAKTRLPVKETPEFHSDKPDDWAVVEKVDGDATDAIQKAIDSGKPIIGLANGGYTVSRTIVVRGPVRKIMGFQSSISPVKGMAVEPLIRFEGKAGESTILEHLWMTGKVEHAGQGTFTMRHVDHRGYSNTGDGDCFAEDTIGKPYIISGKQHFWGRQINCEFGEEPLVENRGGVLWILMFKTEGQMVGLKQTAGHSEIAGALIYPLRPCEPTTPIFQIDGGQATLTYTTNGAPKDQYKLHVKTPTRELKPGDLKARSGLLVPVNAEK